MDSINICKKIASLKTSQESIVKSEEEERLDNSFPPNIKSSNEQENSNTLHELPENKGIFIN